MGVVGEAPPGRDRRDGAVELQGIGEVGAAAVQPGGADRPRDGAVLILKQVVQQARRDVVGGGDRLWCQTRITQPLLDVGVDPGLQHPPAGLRRSSLCRVVAQLVAEHRGHQVEDHGGQPGRVGAGVLRGVGDQPADHVDHQGGHPAPAGDGCADQASDELFRYGQQAAGERHHHQVQPAVDRLPPAVEGPGRVVEGHLSRYEPGATIALCHVDLTTQGHQEAEGLRVAAADEPLGTVDLQTQIVGGDHGGHLDAAEGHHPDAGPDRRGHFGAYVDRDRDLSDRRPEAGEPLRHRKVVAAEHHAHRFPRSTAVRPPSGVAAAAVNQI
jgi:hypothetical protein